jgi:hypothetical protein
MADDTPIPVADVEDENPPEDLKRRPIPAYSEPVAAAPTARAIPVGSTEDLESRIAPRPLPSGRAIPITPGSTEDLEDKSLQTFEHPKSAPIQTGVASLWTKAENIHNPILRVLGEIGAGGARALDAAGQAVGKVIPAVGAVESAIPGTTMNAEAAQRTQAKQDAQQAELAGKEATTAHEQAQTGAIPAETGLKEAQTTALQTPKQDKPETPQQVLAGIENEDLDKGVDPTKDPRVQQVSDTITGLQKEPTAKTPNDFEQFYSDWLKDNNFPDTSHNRLMARQAYAKAGQLPQHEPRQLAVGPDGKVIELTPGMTVPQGTKTVAGDLSVGKPTADEQRRADLAENLNENLGTLEDIVNRRPDLFGPIAGRVTGLKAAMGSNDPDIGTLETIKHQIGMAQISAHGMRSAQGIDGASQSILNSFKNGPDAMKASIEAARKSVKTFAEDVDKAKGKGSAEGGVSVAAPNGKSYNFPDQASADRFKKEAGIK